MPHRCVHCSKIIAAGSREILEGCSNCSGKFFFYIKDEVAKKIQQDKQINAEQIIAESKPETLEIEVKPQTKSDELMEEFNSVDKKKVEEDVRTILGVEDVEKPVILDIESVKVLSPGKFEIDLVSLMNRKPIVFKLEEGKYIIDLSTLSKDFLSKDKK